MHVLDIDNDSLLMKRDDGFYTSGILYTMQALVTEAGQARAAGWRIGQICQECEYNILYKPEARNGTGKGDTLGWLFLLPTQTF